MTGTVVVDASVMLALLLREEEASRAQEAAARWLRDDVRIVVPELFWLEVLNGLRRRGQSGERIVEAIHDLDVMGVETVPFDRALLLLANDLVERHALTAYGAAYLALAVASGATLATLDEELRRAAGPTIEVGIWPEGVDHRVSSDPAPYGTSEVTWPRWPGAGRYLGRLRREVGGDDPSRMRPEVPRQTAAAP